MVEKPIARSRNKASTNEKLPTFEQYLSQTLDKLFSSLKSGDFATGCSILAELSEGLNHVDAYDAVIQMDAGVAVYTDEMRSADVCSWVWYLNSLGTALSKVGRFDEAIAKTNEMLTLGKSLSDEEMQSTAIQNLGVISYSGGKVDDAKRFYLLALEIKERIGDKRGQAQILNNLASMAIQDGELDDAESLLRRSLAIKKRLRNREDMLPAYSTSGDLAVIRADFQLARKCFRKALQIAEFIGSAEDSALSYLNLGNVTMELGDGTEALSHYRAGLKIALNRRLVQAEELLLQALAVGYNRLGLYADAQEAFQRLADVKRQRGKYFDEAMAYHDAAVVSVHLGDSDAALSFYRKAARGFRRADNAEWEARSLWEMASSLVCAGRTEKVSRIVRRAVGVLRRNGCTDTLPEAYAAGVHVLFQAGQVDRAVSLFREESLFLERHGDAEDWARRLAQVGNRLLGYNRSWRAIPFLQQAVLVYHDSSDSTSEAFARNDLAMACAELGHVNKAKSEYTQVLAQSVLENDRVLRLLALRNLAEVERRSGNFQTAIDFGLQSIDLAEQINDTGSLTMILNNLGLAYEDSGDTRKARSCFRRSVRNAEQHQDHQAQARALISLGNSDFVRGQYERALGYYEQARSVTECMSSTLAVDALESCLMCLISLGRLDDASKTADQAVEAADKIGEFEKAEDIARRIALANLRNGKLKACANSLMTSFSYASKKSMKSAFRNIATWAVLLRDAEHEPYGREALHKAITETLEHFAPDQALALNEMLDMAVNILNDQD